ncbi:hypothetical protein TD95_000246 [Thielaviopsis punctulata]|uniref:Uncharacterized protein n=1 Tax=Thielaviopsis punctulata TaxID=72032 RepID=A0A0F4ZEB2_9PEZI|nr:hypothetical protein TD95_000246 [Thielaviopsis punctulata]
MSYNAIGYVLRDRSWAILDVGLLQQLESKGRNIKSSGGDSKEKKQVKGFNDLVLPKGHEDMVVSLIEQHARNKLLDKNNKEQYDIVHGKGRPPQIEMHQCA